MQFYTPPNSRSFPQFSAVFDLGLHFWGMKMEFVLIIN